MCMCWYKRQTRQENVCNVCVSAGEHVCELDYNPCESKAPDLQLPLLTYCLFPRPAPRPWPGLLALMDQLSALRRPPTDGCPVRATHGRLACFHRWLWLVSFTVLHHAPLRRVVLRRSAVPGPSSGSGSSSGFGLLCTTPKQPQAMTLGPLPQTSKQACKYSNRLIGMKGRNSHE